MHRNAMSFVRTRVPVMTTIALALTGLVPLLTVCQTTSLFEKKGGTKHSSADELKKSLEVTASRFLAILEQGNPRDLVDVVSRKGVVIGPEPPPIGFKFIREQIENKEKVYCLLFDTACLRKEWGEYFLVGKPSSTLYSYREMLRKAPGRKINVSVSRSSDEWFGDAWFGQLNVILKREAREDHFWVGGFLDFVFKYEKGGWKLVAIPY